MPARCFPAHRPLSVAVLVTLARGPEAGGHVKCWERFAEAAATLPTSLLDLTVYTINDTELRASLADHVHFHAVPAALGTARLPFLEQGAGHTDLAGHNRRLARHLDTHDVLHTTDTFAFAKTARTLARRRNTALVASIHTDLPAFTAVYSREILARLTGTGWLGRRVLDDLDMPGRLGRDAARTVARFLTDCDRVLVSKESDRVMAQEAVGADRVGWLRRGLDKERFHPRHRDRERLHQDLGIPTDRPLLLFVGRADDSKRLMTLGQAARQLVDAGHDLHVLAVGQGNRRDDLLGLLGSAHATAPGAVPQEELGRIYASADLFVFPSESEVSPNVVLEARASGLPVVLSARDGGARFVHEPGRDGLLVDGPDPAAWAEAITPLLTDAKARQAMGALARAIVEQSVPSWRDVLEEDLLPVWQAAARKHGPVT